MITRLVNINNTQWCEVYIGRGGNGYDGYFGNPFRCPKDGSHEQVIAKYKDYFYSRLEYDLEFKERVLELKGKVLGCFCVPKKCHGNIIVEYLENGNDGSTID